MKKSFSFVLLVFIVVFLVLAEASTSYDNADSLTHDDQVSLYKKYGARKINCSYECARRCRKASRQKICHRACKTCCARCHCVPPGTYGNKSVCPCYARLTTHRNRPKCP